MSTSVIRYVITKLNKDGERTLFDATQGRYTYATEREAQARLDAIKANNDMARYERFPDSLEVRPCECWPVHFDPKGIWFS